MAISISSCTRQSHPLVRHHLRLLCTTTTTSPSLRPPPQPKPATIDPAVKRLAKSRLFSDIPPLLEDKKKETSKITEEPYLSSIIVSYAYANMLDQATATFDEMDQLGCVPRTAISLNALLTSYNHLGRHAEVPALFADLSKKHSITPDAITYGILITALCESGETGKACGVLDEMKEKNVGISAFTYTPIVDALYKKKKPEEAEKVWKEMVGRGCAPDAAAFNVRAMYVGNHGKPQGMMELMSEMEAAGVKPDIVTYNLLITCYCMNGKFLDAKELYRTLREKKVYPNAATFRNLTRFLCKNGDFDAAFKVCKEGIMKRKIPDFGPGRSLIEGLVKNSREEEAKWLAGQLREKFPASFTEAWKKVEEKLGLSVADGKGTAQLEAAAP